MNLMSGAGGGMIGPRPAAQYQEQVTFLSYIFWVSFLLQLFVKYMV
jgi:hypothetical protein